MKKGFTLIELLAVIVILSVIALIATPMILNVIEESKKQALEASVKGIIESTRYFSMKNDDINSSVYEFKFDENNKGVTPNGESLNYTGSVEAEGKLILDREGNISLCLMNDKYYVYKNYNSGVVVGNRSEDSCNVEYDSLTNKYIAFLESEGSVSNVYSKDEVDSLIANVNTSITNNTNEITNIKSSIETLQNDLSNYALKSELQETNTNLENLSSIVNGNTSSINNMQTDLTNLTTSVDANTTNINTLTDKVSNLFKFYYLNDEIVDCNNLPVNSVGYTYNDTLNSPAQGSLVFTYGRGSNSWRVQLAIQYTTGNLYTRGYTATTDTWSAWAQK